LALYQPFTLECSLLSTSGKSVLQLVARSAVTRALERSLFCSPYSERWGKGKASRL